MTLTVLVLVGVTAAKATAVLLFTAVAAVSLRHRSAALRHAVWTAGVVAVLALPLLGHLTPAVKVPVHTPEPIANAAPVGGSVNAGGPDDYTTAGTAAGYAGVIDASEFSGAEAGGDGQVPAPAGFRGSVPRSGAPRSSAIPLPAAGRWPTLLIGVWIGGAMAVLTGLLLGVLRLAWLAHQSLPILSGPIWRAARRPALQAGLSATPRLLTGPVNSIPMTWGFLRPAVLLPPEASRWSEVRLHAVLLHEFGHVARHDYLIQVLAQLACSLHWFNPLAWVAAHRLRVERELACDDVVIAGGQEAAAYADELLDLARALRLPRAVPIAVGMARTTSLRARLLAILDDSRDRSPVSRRRMAGVGLTVIGAATFVAALAPHAARTQERSDAPAKPATATGIAVAKDAASFMKDSVSAVKQASPTVTATAVSAGSGSAAVQVAGAYAYGIGAGHALCGPSDGEVHHRSHHTDDASTHLETEYGNCRTTVAIEGDLEFSDDFRRIVRIPSDSHIRFAVERPGERRRLEGRSGEGGQSEYRWWVDGDERPFGADAETWFHDALLDLFRQSGYRAKERAAAILRTGGVDAVLAEVDAMESRYAKSLYLRLTLETGRVTLQEVRRIFREGAVGLGSEHAIVELLVRAASTYHFDPETHEEFLRAATGIESGQARGRVYRSLLQQPDLRPTHTAAVLGGVREIGSDHERSALLIELAERGLPSAVLQRAYLTAASSIGSDQAKAESLRALMGTDGVGEVEQVELLRAARGIAGDHLVSELLVEFIGRYPVEGAVRRAFLDTLDTVGSDDAHEGVATALREREG
jgi:beta-lactamase regulating signal transducer with metallopeptidase domain